MSVKCILTEQEKTLSELQISKFYNNKNLAINWDFRKPVNKNGENIYTISNSKQITIDMWEAEHNGILQIMDGYIFISCTSTDNDGYINFYQRLNQNYLPLNGKTITISAILSGNCSITHGYKPPEYDYRWSQGIAYNSNSIGLYTETYILPADASDIIPLLFQMREGEEVNIYAVKVEIGDTQTLAHQDSEGNWIINEPIDYNLQYALCSQYSPNTGEFIKNQYSNTNLADNWYFVDPINQREQTVYTIQALPQGNSMFTIDRIGVGVSANTSAKLTIQDNGILLSCQPPEGKSLQTNIYQSIEVGKFPKGVYTLTWLYESDVIVRPFAYTFENGVKPGFMDFPITSGKPNIASITFNLNEGDTVLVVNAQINSNITTNTKFYAVKLEFGSTQTLAHKENNTWVLNDLPPNRVVELTKCKRYFQSLNGNFGTGSIADDGIHLGINLPISMRTTPTFSHGKINVQLNGSMNIGHYYENVQPIFKWGSNDSLTLLLHNPDTSAFPVAGIVSARIDGPLYFNADF